MATDIQATEKAKPVLTTELIEQLTEARRLLWNNGILAHRENERMKNRIMREHVRAVSTAVDNIAGPAQKLAEKLADQFQQNGQYSQ